MEPGQFNSGATALKFCAFLEKLEECAAGDERRMGGGFTEFERFAEGAEQNEVTEVRFRQIQGDLGQDEGCSDCRLFWVKLVCNILVPGVQLNS